MKTQFTVNRCMEMQRVMHPFILLYFLFWPLCCLFFFDRRILVAPLVSSNSSSYRKISHICPVSRNKDDNSEKFNYRPFALLSCMPRIIEKIMYKSVYKYCVSHVLYINGNSWYKRNDSTVNQLLAIIHDIYKSHDSGKDVCVIFLDVSKASDKVWYEGLIFKLRQLA